MLGHFFQGLLARQLCVAILADCCTVAFERGAGCLQLREITGWNTAGQRIDAGQGLVDSCVGILFEFGTTAVGVAAYLKARLLDQLADVNHGIKLHDAVTLQQRGFDLVHLFHSLVGRSAQIGTTGFTCLDGLGQL